MLMIKNWSSFQSYKDRSPPWIRLHRRLIDNYDFQKMSVNARAILPMLWLIASEHNDPKSGKIELSFEALAFRLRISTDEMTSAIHECVKNNFVEITDNNQQVTYPLQNDYASDTEKLRNCHSESEDRVRGQSQSRAEGLELSKPNSNPVGIFKKNIQPHNNGLTDEQKKNRDEINKLVEVVLSCFKRLSFRTSPRIITDTHIKLIKARIEQDKRHQSPDYWEWFFGQVEESDFLSGRIAPIGDRRLFKPSLEWLFNKNNFAKVVNGNYANTTRRIS